MIDPMSAYTIGSAAVGLGRSIFGGKKYKYREPAPFAYNPAGLESDPELLLRRRRALLDIGRSRSQYTNEIGRAGLLGTGKQFELLGEQERMGLGELEGIDDSVAARRREEQYQDYRDKVAFDRRRALMSDDADYEESRAGLSALGGLGGDLGRSILSRRDMLFDPDEYWRKIGRQNSGDFIDPFIGM